MDCFVSSWAAATACPGTVIPAMKIITRAVMVESVLFIRPPDLAAVTLLSNVLGIVSVVAQQGLETTLNYVGSTP